MLLGMQALLLTLFFSLRFTLLVFLFYSLAHSILSAAPMWESEGMRNRLARDWVARITEC